MRNVAAFVFLMTLVLSCGLGEMSPGETVAAMYDAGNEGRYSDVLELSSSDVRSALESGAYLAQGGVKGVWSRVTRDGTIEKVEVVEEKIRGEGADVSIRIIFKDGDSMNEEVPLVKEEGSWRVTLGEN